MLHNAKVKILFAILAILLNRKKLSFSSSNSHAENSFDLIHVHIRRPYSSISINGYNRYFFTIFGDHISFTSLLPMKRKLKLKLV